MTELSARNLRERLRKIRCEDLEQEAIQAEVDAAVGDVSNGFMEETAKYDRETNHGRAKDKQKDWDNKLRAQLELTKGQ